MLALERQNRLRERYRQRRPGWQPATERFAALVGDRLRPQSRVLDLGCGRGGLVEQLGHPLTQMVGVDPDWASLREHRLPLPRAAALSDALPLAAASVDLVYASWVLEHLPRPAADLRAVRRVLRPAGVFIFVTPNRRHPLIALNRGLGRLGRLQQALITRLYDRAGADTFPAYYRANSPVALRHLAEETGFAVDVLLTIADPTYLAFHPALLPALAALEERLPADRRLHLVGCLRAI